MIDTKARMTLKAENYKLYLSFLWWVIEPLFFVCAYYFVFSFLMGGRQENFLVFLMCAKVPYMLFSKGITNASTSIVGNKGIICQIDIPKFIFPYAAIQVCIYKEMPVFALLIGMCIYYGFYPQKEWLLLIPLFIVLYMIIVASGLFSALLVCYVEDMRMLINMVMMLLMFVSGIFFDIHQIHQPVQNYLLILNPLAFICDGFRTILMNKGIYNINHLVILALICFITILTLHVVYNKHNRTIAARVVNS